MLSPTDSLQSYGKRRSTDPLSISSSLLDITLVSPATPIRSGKTSVQCSKSLTQVLYPLDTMVHRTRALDNSTLLADARCQLLLSYMYRTRDVKITDQSAMPMYIHNNKLRDLLDWHIQVFTYRKLNPKNWGSRLFMLTNFILGITLHALHC